MSIDIGSADGRPKQERLAVALRAAIVAGVYPPGDVLPSRRELAVLLAVSPTTVGLAVEMLRREGLVVSEPGVGMVVVDVHEAA